MGSWARPHDPYDAGDVVDAACGYRAPEASEVETTNMTDRQG
jgi:hypothetical protein